MLRALFPAQLWNRRFLAAWLGVLVTILCFDLLWCTQTTFRALNFAGTYINLLLLATLLTFPTLLWRKAWPQALVTLAMAMLMCANLMYCLTYFDAIPPASYALVGNVMGFTASIADSFRPQFLLLFIPAIAAWFVMKRSPWHPVSSKIWKYWGLTAGVLIIISATVALCAGGMRKHIGQLRQSCYYATTPPVIYTPFGFLIAQLWEQEEKLTPEIENEVNGWIAEHRAFAADSLAITQGDVADSLRRPDNLVVVFCESLEAWPVGLKLEGKEITPNINKAIADTASGSWVARRVLSQVGSGRSIEGQLLTLTGMYPIRDLVYSMRYPDNFYPSLPRAMKEAGARTWLLSGDAPSTWNQARIARSFGIDTLLLADTWDLTEKIGHPARISDKAFISQVVEKMRAGEVWPEGSKGYVQIVTYTSHNPFRIPDEMKTLHLNGEYPEVMRDYLTAVHYTDAALGSLFDYLRTRSDWERTMVVIVGDHEALASRRSEILQSPAARNVVDEEEFVPLIILNGRFSGNRKDVMGQADAYAAILDQLGSRYHWRGMGFSPFQNPSPRFAFNYFGKAVGDTTSADARLRQHIRRAPEISEKLIRFDLLKK